MSMWAEAGAEVRDVGGVRLNSDQTDSARRRSVYLLTSLLFSVNDVREDTKVNKFQET